MNAWEGQAHDIKIAFWLISCCRLNKATAFLIQVCSILYQAENMQICLKCISVQVHSDFHLVMLRYQLYAVCICTLCTSCAEAGNVRFCSHLSGHFTARVREENAFLLQTCRWPQLMLLLKLNGWWTLIKMSDNTEIDGFHKAWLKEDKARVKEDEGYECSSTYAAAANCTSGAAASAAAHTGRPTALRVPCNSLQLSDCSSEWVTSNAM